MDENEPSPECDTLENEYEEQLYPNKVTYMYIKFIRNIKLLITYFLCYSTNNKTLLLIPSDIIPAGRGRYY